MTKKTILMGFEVKSGKKVEIPLAHIIVTGITALSGKTTTIEGLIKRSGLKAVIFKTKIGESGITEGTVIPPYFKENSSWQYVQSLLEATMKERLKFERSWIIEACKNTNSLLEVKTNIDRFLAEGKNSQGGHLNNLSRSVYTTLQAYFELILPQLQYSNFSKTLELREGINIIDLERYKIEIQSLVIRSVLENILNEQKGIIVVIPELWKFCPQTRGNPVKNIAEEFIRQGATNHNFLWADSQDLANVDKTILKQISVWALGLQQERNEVKHTIDQIPLSKSQKPNPEEIMTLEIGHFFVVTPDIVKKVYVMPSWLDEKTAIDIAIGKKKAGEIQKPSSIAPFSIIPKARDEIPNFESQKIYAKIQQDMIELRQDFFNKQQQMQEQANRLIEEIYKLQTHKQEINTDEIVSIVLQKLPAQKSQSVNPVSLDKESIVREILSRVPRMSGAVTYEVAPLEKIKKDFLEETKNKILKDIGGLSDESKRMLKYLESRDKGVKSLELEEKCFFMKHSGSSSNKVSKSSIELRSVEVAQKDTAGFHRGKLKDRIKELLGTHEATEQEMENLYQHILMELLGADK
jgi:hypothetical protein